MTHEEALVKARWMTGKYWVANDEAAGDIARALQLANLDGKIDAMRECASRYARGFDEGSPFHQRRIAELTAEREKLL